MTWRTKFSEIKAGSQVIVIDDEHIPRAWHVGKGDLLIISEIIIKKYYFGNQKRYLLKGEMKLV
ncbi:MAG: hypothetical protein ACTSQE_17345 [Candidatus Heimdallarchaeaceae archaeon]